MTHKLYILMRSDMISLNPGKAVAQGAHAANRFTFWMDKIQKNKDLHKQYKDEIAAYKEWLGEEGFGTVVTLDGPISVIDDAIRNATNCDILSDWIVDSSYPLKDGDTTHHFPCKTCAFVFVPSFSLTPPCIKKMRMMP